MSSVLIATFALGILGLAFAFLLAMFYRRFAVPTDPRQEGIMGALPGANCGACGFAGCQGMADALMESKAEVTSCPAGGSAVAKKLAALMGVSVEEKEDRTAFVACRAGRSTAKFKYTYSGVDNCQAASLLFGGDKLCTYGCLGLGSCVRVCSFDAIRINDEGLAVVDREKCTSCGKCVNACPRQMISLVPKNKPVFVGCMNHGRGKAVRDVCAIGCIACKICEKNCPEGAIVLVDNLPVIDFSKCTGCNTCVEKCPQNTMVNIREGVLN